MKRPNLLIWLCRVDFKTGPTRVSQVLLTVNSHPTKPVILDNRGREVNRKLGPYQLGQSLVVSCSVLGGKPSPSVVWYMDRKVVDSTFEKEDSRVVNSLTIENLKREHLDAILTCQAKNSKESHKITSVKLDLTFPPSEVVIQGADQPLSSGVSHRLECIANGSRPQPILEWWMGRQPLAGSKQTGEKSVLKITPGPSENGKPVRCTAKMPGLGLASTKEASINLNVTYLTSVEILAQNWTVEEGEDLLMTCQVKANPPPHSVQWYKDNQSISLPSKNLTLQLKSVNKESSGSYFCKASNLEGSESSPPKPLVVLFPPICQDKPRSLRVYLREEVAVKCNVLAVPSSNVSFHWRFMAKGSGEVVEIRGNQTKTHDLSSEFKYTLDSERDIGTLFCWAENDVGQLKTPCRIDLLPFTPPSPPHSCTLFQPGTKTILDQFEPGTKSFLNQFEPGKKTFLNQLFYILFRSQHIVQSWRRWR